MKPLVKFLIVIILCISNVEVIALDDLFKFDDPIELDWELEDVRQDDLREKDSSKKKLTDSDDNSGFDVTNQPEPLHFNTHFKLLADIRIFRCVPARKIYRMNCQYQLYG